jgi:two-component system cell cycle response regulator DivK
VAGWNARSLVTTGGLMKRILLVDDNEMNLDMLSRRLERRGFSVVSAADGRQALTKAYEAKPDLILLDMSLPEISGFEVASMLRKNMETAETPIIALTAYATEGDRRRALEAGCDDYDTKPVDLARLLMKIDLLSNKIAGDEDES